MATNTEPECDDPGGGFHEGETCPEFGCPEPDLLVEAPFTSELLSACGAGDDCALRDTEEHEYEVIIPHTGVRNFNTCLHSDLDTYIFPGTALRTEDRIREAEPCRDNGDGGH